MRESNLARTRRSLRRSDPNWSSSRGIPAVCQSSLSSSLAIARRRLRRRWRAGDPPSSPWTCFSIVYHMLRASLPPAGISRDTDASLFVHYVRSIKGPGCSPSPPAVPVFRLSRLQVPNPPQRPPASLLLMTVSRCSAQLGQRPRYDHERQLFSMALLLSPGFSNCKRVVLYILPKIDLLHVLYSLIQSEARPPKVDI